jgi:hypothetical protein
MMVALTALSPGPEVKRRGATSDQIFVAANLDNESLYRSAAYSSSRIPCIATQSHAWTTGRLHRNLNWA